MFSTFNLLVLKCSILYHILHGDGQSLSSSRHSTHRFINFVKHSFNYLSATKISNKLAVRSFDECGIQCVRTSTCLSVNMASSSDDNGVYWCEILASDKYMSSESFKPSPNSHHFSIMVSVGWYWKGQVQNEYFTFSSAERFSKKTNGEKAWLLFFRLNQKNINFNQVKNNLRSSRAQSKSAMGGLWLERAENEQCSYKTN